MASIQLFESDVALNPRIELFFDDVANVFSVNLLDAANNAVKTLTMTTALIGLMRAIWQNGKNDAVCIEGGPATAGVDDYWATFTRENSMTWSILQGATPEVAVLTREQTSEVMGWLIGGRHQPSA